MKRQKLIDTIIKEPLGGAHTNREAMFDTVRKTICKTYKELQELPTDGFGARTHGQVFCHGCL
jgi:acetyl-CoA carboxylase carboxyl transferase subunit alpha